MSAGAEHQGMSREKVDVSEAMEGAIENLDPPKDSKLRPEIKEEMRLSLIHSKRVRKPGVKRISIVPRRSKTVEQKPKNTGQRSGTITMQDGSRYRFGKRFSQDGTVEMDFAEMGPVSNDLVDVADDTSDDELFESFSGGSTSTGEDSNNYLGSVSSGIEAGVRRMAEDDVSDNNPNSLKSVLRITAGNMAKRNKAKESYMKKHKKLITSYEKKLMEAHKKFVKRSGKLATETATSELDGLKDKWITIPIRHWDNLICKHYYDKSVTLWNLIRDKKDMKKNDENEMKLGDVTRWVLDLFYEEEKQQIRLRKKQRQKRKRLANKVLSISGLKSESLNDAIRVLEENNDNVSQAVAALLDGQVNADRLARIQDVDMNALRNIICRIVDVDASNETIKIVMVLDRNERPCLGGLPPPPPPPAVAEETDDANGDNIGSQDDSEANDGDTDLSILEALEAPVVAEEDDESLDGDLIPGTISKEKPNASPIEYFCDLEELMSLSAIRVLDIKEIEQAKEKFEANVPSLTYQKQRYGEDFQLIDLGVKLGLEPLSPLQEYTPEWRNGTLYSLKHNVDGPVRFVGYNETGFGLIDQTTPMQLYTQQMTNSSGEVVGINVVHMTLFDINDEVSFDRLYLKPDEDLDDHSDGKIFARNANGQRLKYRIVAQQDQVVAILYPFQGRVRRANLVQQPVPATGTIVSLFGSGKIGKMAMVPVGMVIGEAVENPVTACKFKATDMTEMLRAGIRHFPEFPGMVDIEILVDEEGSLLEPPLQESWPVECVMEASMEIQVQLEEAYKRKEIQKANFEAQGRQMFNDLRVMVTNRPKKITKDIAAESLERLLKLKADVEKMQAETNCVEEKEYLRTMNAVRSYRIVLARAAKKR